jgi:hypothetical protein
MRKMSTIFLSTLLVLSFSVTAMAQPAPGVEATAVVGNVQATVNQGGQNQGQDQQQQQKQGQAQAITGNNSNVSLTQIGAPIPRSFPIPGQVSYAPMPQEFGNGSVDPNVQDLRVLCSFITNPMDRVGAEKMAGGSIRIQAHTLTDWKSKEEKTAADAINIVFAKPENVRLAKVGSVVASTKDGKSLTEEALHEMALSAMDMKGAKYLLVLAQGVQKVTQTWGFGVALGYTHAFISDDGQKAGTGTLGIGFSMGEAGRKGNPWIQAVVLGDEESMKAVTVKK